MKRKLQGRDKQRFDSADWEIEKTKVSIATLMIIYECFFKN